MHHNIVFSAFLLSASALASFSIDRSEEQRVATDIDNYANFIAADPVFKTDVADIEKDLPKSVVEEAKSDPKALIHEFATKTSLPAYVEALPTNALDSLECLAAPPLNAVHDVEKYVSSVVQEPSIQAAIAVLATAVPASIQQRIRADPAAVIKDVITATTTEAWVTALPTAVQSEFESIFDRGLQIFASDLEASATTSCVAASVTGKHHSKATASRGSSEGYIPSPTVVASGSGTGVGAAQRPTGSPIVAFEGAASSIRHAAVGLAIFAAGASLWLCA